jgi:hypothetical protein
LGADLDRPANVDYPDRFVLVALGIDALEVEDQAQPAKSTGQDFEPADDLSVALVRTVTGSLVAVPDIPDRMEVAPKQGEVESQSSLRIAESQTLGSKLKVAF